jgi:hypothetical protein
MIGLRKWVSELMIYDANDKLSRDEATEFVEGNSVGGWTVASEGIEGVGDMGRALRTCCHVRQLTICSHGFPGGAWFPKGSLTTLSLRQVSIPGDLFEREGRLLFMGCETARTPDGRDFLIAAGRHFFAGRGGIVGGATIQLSGFSSGTRMGMVGWTSEGHLPTHVGRLVLIKLNADGEIVGEKTVSAFE